MPYHAHLLLGAANMMLKADKNDDQNDDSYHWPVRAMYLASTSIWSHTQRKDIFNQNNFQNAVTLLFSVL